MDCDKWLLCPICGNKTCDKIREDTGLKNFPLFCPKCKFPRNIITCARKLKIHFQKKDIK